MANVRMNSKNPFSVMSKIIVSRDSFPNVYRQLYENQDNYTLMSYLLLSFNKRMNAEYRIPMPVLLLADRLIVDQNCWLSFQEFCQENNISVDFNAYNYDSI